jgi:hypothetical protein
MEALKLKDELFGQESVESLYEDFRIFKSNCKTPRLRLAGK